MDRVQRRFSSTFQQIGVCTLCIIDGRAFYHKICQEVTGLLKRSNHQMAVFHWKRTHTVFTERGRREARRGQASGFAFTISSRHFTTSGLVTGIGLLSRWPLSGMITSAAASSGCFSFNGSNFSFCAISLNLLW
jgi:hypothetical protein